MRIVRLPGIHHDSNVILVIGTLGCIVIDAGTSWYQALQLERIQGILDGNDSTNLTVDRILLTSRRFPCSGGASFLSAQLGNCPIHIHREGRSSLETGDFFTTWANRFDSDMPFTKTEVVEDGDVFALGDGQVCAMALPGHCSDNMAYHIPEKELIIAGQLIPRADRPTRWDMPTGCLPDIVESLKSIKKLKPQTIIPLQGPAIKGKSHVTEILERHIRFFEECILRDGKAPKSWSRPAQTALWLTPQPPWPLAEKEEVN
ncbi:MAG TPA: MBL fold metallo-hydrolase [Candidatus Poseidoniaceae archaeon]|nr:MAG TPA: MBL fold metallo-hydrolase [Candidatus Poseidoniales archaeon]HII45676.1 MBL fold metallo-hydrolase [Candidatus Poseidoniaceae archaeon]